MLYQLVLKNINLRVKLGHLEEERSYPQQVLAQIKLQFLTAPLACITDNLQDAICYAFLAEELQKFCETRSFKLIEALTYQLFQFLKQKMLEMNFEKVNLYLSITKNPPMPNLERSSFVMSD
jgi:7,8-dihydroneopterin aldolase/epimerase/oxygenase